MYEIHTLQVYVHIHYAGNHSNYIRIYYSYRWFCKHSRISIIYNLICVRYVIKYVLIREISGYKSVACNTLQDTYRPQTSLTIVEHKIGMKKLAILMKEHNIITHCYKCMPTKCKKYLQWLHIYKI